MSLPDPSPLFGDALLEAVTDAMVALHVRYYHRTPASAKTQLLGGDLLACVLGGIYTDVEKTMIELGRGGSVHDTRGQFQHAMRHKFVEAVERLSGRTVIAFISNHHVGPDLAVELFWLDGSKPAASDPEPGQSG
ncbi:Na-translocating system protein MpsC family protein [Solirubrobacter phytolaccae]|uniref:Na-translocating system protein MpsC family protein n=1 Tax=Solirubrobacter phytolaccae TaxID=1404360 RepID=A0A9X3NC01_9ACTN|nr:Na-translocating system protein MpsC family protein [Solirubrobacter phytolaccae]MDA0183658.1 Na-translocating system protein MpsC family protein [Solirubrobacter phytolaccae]